MIPHNLIIRELSKERGYWQRNQLRTHYVQGMIDGFTLAIKIVDQLWELVLTRIKLNPKYVQMCSYHCLKEAKRRGL